MTKDELLAKMEQETQELEAQYSIWVDRRDDDRLAGRDSTHAAERMAYWWARYEQMTIARRWAEQLQ